MVSATWQPLGVAARWALEDDGGPAQWNSTFTASAAVSEDGRTLVVRLSSRAPQPVNVTILLEGCGGQQWANATYVATMLSAASLTAVNSWAGPRQVAPVTSTRAPLEAPLLMPANGFAVVVVTR